jgi:hypothetical protein
MCVNHGTPIRGAICLCQLDISVRTVENQAGRFLHMEHENSLTDLAGSSASIF